MARKRRGRVVNGWVLLDKPEGMLSTEALNRVRRLFGAAKAGHAGTLDPLASGLLPIGLGEATKIIGRVVDAGKRYRFIIRWGEERDTDDADGAVVATSALRPSRAALLEAMARYRGEIEQVPPAYSAVKVDG